MLCSLDHKMQAFGFSLSSQTSMYIVWFIFLACHSFSETKTNLKTWKLRIKFPLFTHSSFRVTTSHYYITTW